MKSSFGLNYLHFKADTNEVKTYSSMLLLLLLGPLLTTCATKYNVVTYPAGAKVRIENVVTKESIDIGEGPLTFEHEERFGEGFVLIAEKEAFTPKRIYVTKQQASETSFVINLEPKKNTEPGPETAGKDDEKKDPEKRPPDQSAEMDKRLSVLERAFEIYKDALFSARMSSGPPSYDRDRTDLTVALVSQAQQHIERKRLKEAMAVVDKILERNEYLSQGHVLKGTVHYLRGDYQQAVVSWERALEINPYDKLTRQYLIKAYQAVGHKLPENVEEINQIDRSPAAAPLQPDPLKLRLRNR